jgi:hypothetical protein
LKSNIMAKVYLKKTTATRTSLTLDIKPYKKEKL